MATEAEILAAARELNAAVLALNNAVEQHRLAEEAFGAAAAEVERLQRAARATREWMVNLVAGNHPPVQPGPSRREFT